MKLGYLGLGETHDFCILAASFDPLQNNFLKLNKEEHPQLLNVFHVGCLINKEQVKQQGVGGEFRFMFSFSAGFSKQELIDFSQQLSDNKVKVISSNQPEILLDYTINVSASCSLNCKIDYFLKRPIVVELVGQEYVHDMKTQFWTLRHPVLVKQAAADKHWQDTVSFQELQVSFF